MHKWAVNDLKRLDRSITKTHGITKEALAERSHDTLSLQSGMSLIYSETGQTISTSALIRMDMDMDVGIGMGTGMEMGREMDMTPYKRLGDSGYDSARVGSDADGVYVSDSVGVGSGFDDDIVGGLSKRGSISVGVAHSHHSMHTL